jgi:ubiquinol-cytochrome c reductase cytochrome c subunit
MPHFARVIAIGTIGLGALAFAAPTQLARPEAAAAAPLAQDAARGQHLYTLYGCYQCHGFVGQGAGATGPRIAPNPMAYNRFEQQIYEPRDLMPRYPREFVSEQDVADMYAYLQSIPPAPDPAEIPLLNQ